MNKFYNALAAIAFACFVLPVVASAQSMTTAQLQSEVQSLTAELQLLEQQLAAQGGSASAWCYNFNANLSIGMTGSAVTALQTALLKDGESVTVSGTFNDQTASAVTGFQQKYASIILAPYGLQNGTGYAGKSTRAELNSLYGCGVATAPTPVLPIVPVANPTPISAPTPSDVAPGSLMVSQGANIQSTVTPGQTGVLIGSYSLVASQSEGVNLDTLGITVGTADFQNVRIYVNGSPFGTAWAQPISGGSFIFAASSPVSIPAGTMATVQVFADVSSSAQGGQVAAATAVSGCTASGIAENDSVVCNAVGGQSLTIGSGGPDTSPWAEVQPTTLQFVAAPGESNAQVSPKTVMLYTSAAEPISVSAASAQGWLQVSAPQSSANPNGIPNGTSIIVTVLPSSLAAGPYSGTITISSPTNQFSPISIPVTLTVTSITSTQIMTILSPATGTVWTQGTSQNVEWQTASPGQPVGLGIYLMQNGSIVAPIGTPGNIGTYPWTIPSSYSGSNFQIGILDSGIYTYSGLFSISPAAATTTSAALQGAFTVSSVASNTAPAASAAISAGESAEFVWSLPVGTVSSNAPVATFSIACVPGLTMYDDGANVPFNCGQNYPAGPAGERYIQFQYISSNTAPVQVPVHLNYGASSPLITTVVVTPVAPSSASITINGSHSPISVQAGSPLTIAVSSQNTTSCTGYGGTSMTGSAQDFWKFPWTSTLISPQSATAPMLTTPLPVDYTIECLTPTGLLVDATSEIDVYPAAATNSPTSTAGALSVSVNNSTADNGYFTPSNHQSRSATDDLAEIKFTAGTSGGAILTHLMVTFSGTLAASSNFLSGVQLIDSSGMNITSDGASEAMSSACTASTSCTVTWTIPTSVIQAQIEPGNTGLFKVRVNDQLGPAPQAGVALSLSASIQNTEDLQYYDSTSNNGTTVSIPSSLVPMTLASFALPVGE